MDILRTLLFVPGNRQRMLERAARAGADAIVVDLEDAVPTAEKRAARALVRSAMPQLVASGTPVFVRVNNIGSGGRARDDLMAAVRPGLAGVVHPKTESAQDLRSLDVLIREAELKHGVRPGDIAVIPLIESPVGVLRCEEIALGSDRVIALSFGGEDYATALGVRRSADGAAFAHARGVIATVAAACGLLTIDTPYPDIKDASGLAAESKLAQAMGFKGKFIIHPDQVAAVNAAFTPSRDEIAQARRVLAAAGQARSARRGAIALDGAMVDAPVIERARQLIALAERLGARSAPRSKRAR